MTKVAMVGAEESKWTPKQKTLAMDMIDILLESFYEKDVLVSGRCPKGGVDIWAEERAKVYDTNTEIYVPKTNDWPGYKARNILIAEAADILYCLSPSIDGATVWNGGLWTAKKAEELGKRVVRISIS